jgi:hypothetical protein
VKRAGPFRGPALFSAGFAGQDRRGPPEALGLVDHGREELIEVGESFVAGGSRGVT